MADVDLRAVVHYLRHMAAPGGVGALDDAQLLHRFVQTRDEAAFEVMVWRHGGLVLGVCRNLLHNEQDAEDAFQATFFTLAHRPPASAKGASLAGWLHKVSCRIALRILAQSRRRRAREQHDVDSAALAANPQQGAGATIEQREIWGMVIEELHRLPDSYRRPIISYFLEGKTHEQVARELRRPLGSMSRLLGRGCEMLSVRLSRRGVALPASLLAVAIADSASATLRPELVMSVVTAALNFSAGLAVSGQAAGLANWALASMMLSKAKIPVGVLLALCAVVGGTAGLARQAQLEQAHHPNEVEHQKQSPLAAQKAQPRTDLYGDQLPEGAIARLGTARLQHTLQTTSVSYSPDGNFLASAGSDNDVRIWDLHTGKEARRITHAKAQTVWSALFTADGKTLVTMGSKEDDLCFWDVATGMLIRSLPIFMTAPQLPVLSSDGKMLAVANRGNMQLWDLAKLATIREVKGAQFPFAFSPDSKKVVYSTNTSLHLYDLVTGKDLDWLKTPMPHFLVFSPDGKTLATSEVDEVAHLWDVATGRELFRFEGDGERRDIRAKRGLPTLVAFSPDGKLLAVVGGAGPIRFCEVATGKVVHRWHPKLLTTWSLAFSPDSKCLAVAGAGGDSIRLLDVATGEERLPFRRPPMVGSRVVFLPDGKSLVTGGSCRDPGNGTALGLWDAVTGKDLRQVQCGPDDAYVLPSADGKVVAVRCLGNDTVSVRQAFTGKELWQVTSKNVRRRVGTAISADGKNLVTLGDDNVIHLWGVAEKRELQQFRGSQEAMLVGLSPDSKTLVSSSIFWIKGGDNTLRAWDVASGTERWNLPISKTGNSLSAFSADNKLLATGGADVCLWDVASGTEVRRFQGVPPVVHSAAFSPDGHTLATGGSDHNVRLWEVATGKARGIFRGHEGQEIVSVSFSPDGKLLASTDCMSALIWKLAGPAARLPSEELNSELKALGSDDAARAYRAVCLLAANPESAVSLLSKSLRTEQREDSKKLDELIAALDSDKFPEREKAMQELRRLGERVEPVLRAALQRKLSLEAALRVEELLQSMNNLSPELVLSIRAVEVLEHIGTPEAKQLLQKLAQGAPESRLGCEAKAAFVRLGKSINSVR